MRVPPILLWPIDCLIVELEREWISSLTVDVSPLNLIVGIFPIEVIVVIHFIKLIFLVAKHTLDVEEVLCVQRLILLTCGTGF